MNNKDNNKIMPKCSQTKDGKHVWGEKYHETSYDTGKWVKECLLCGILDMREEGYKEEETQPNLISKEGEGE